jgi:hypothetical protein
MSKITAAAALSILLLLGVASACDREPGGPAEAWFISPAEGEEVTGPDVQVRLGARNIGIAPADSREPNTGHHHIFVNTDLTPLNDTIPSGVPGILHLGQGQTEFLVQGLEPGEHQLISVLADWAHVPLDPPSVDTVRFTVIAPPDGP